MLRTVAILAVTLLASPARGEPVSAFELLPLPSAPGRVSLSADPLERTVTLESARGTPAIARSLRALSRALCPTVTELPGRTVLTCASSRVVPRLVLHGATRALELRELAGLPGSGAGAMPLLFHDPLTLGLGECPGSNHAARGECRLREGRPDLARGSFLTASRSPNRAERDHALLRLGDLELSAGDAAGAQRRWALVESEPWRRMADARRCELSAECLSAKGDAPFSREGVPASVAREMTLRAARVRAFRGEALAAAWAIADQFSSAGACSGEAALCRRIVLAALRSRDESEAREALAIYVAAVKPGSGSFSVELATAAAAVAERSGAPGFAAALLSSSSATVPEPAIGEHLMRTAELYVASGDAVRARVVVDFLRSHGARAGARWAALLRDLATLRARNVPPAGSAERRIEAPELVTAARALDRARSAGAGRASRPEEPQQATAARISQRESGE